MVAMVGVVAGGGDNNVMVMVVINDGGNGCVSRHYDAVPLTLSLPVRNIYAVTITTTAHVFVIVICVTRVRHVPVQCF